MRLWRSGIFPGLRISALQVLRYAFKLPIAKQSDVFVLQSLPSVFRMLDVHGVPQKRQTRPTDRGALRELDFFFVKDRP